MRVGHLVAIGLVVVVATGGALWGTRVVSRDPGQPPLGLFVRGTYGRDSTCAAPVAGADRDNGCAVGTGVDHMPTAGFNTVQADPVPSTLVALGARGLRALVWLGGWDKRACTWEIPDDRLPAVIDPIRGSPVTLAYYLADEPHLSTCRDAPDAFRARTQLVHRLDPGSRTFTLIQDWDEGPVDYSRWKGAVDVLGFDAYPCSFANGADLSARHKVRRACDFGGITVADIDRIERAGITGYLGVLQDFQDCYYELPTATELRQQMDAWQAHARHMAGYLVFSWNWDGERCTYGSLGVKLDDVPGNVSELAYENAHYFRP